MSSHKLQLKHQGQTDIHICLPPATPHYKHFYIYISCNSYIYVFKSLICHRPVVSPTSSFWIAKILWRAASQFAFLPVITIVSELLFSAGRSILVLLSSRICHQKKKNPSKIIWEASHVRKKALEILFCVTNEQGRPVNEISLHAIMVMSSEERNNISPSWCWHLLYLWCSCGIVWRWEQK